MHAISTRSISTLRNVLQSCRVNDQVDAMHGARKSISIPNVPDTESESWILIEYFRHFVLFELVTTIDTNRAIFTTRKYTPREGLPE